MRDRASIEKRSSDTNVHSSSRSTILQAFKKSAIAIKSDSPHQDASSNFF